MKQQKAEIILRDPGRYAHHDRIFLNNPVIMQGMGLAPLVVRDIFTLIQKIRDLGTRYCWWNRMPGAP